MAQLYRSSLWGRDYVKAGTSPIQLGEPRICLAAQCITPGQSSVQDSTCHFKVAGWQPPVPIPYLNLP